MADIARVPTIIEVNLVTAGVEQSQLIVVNTNPHIRKLQLKSRTLDTLQYGYAPGGPYVTIPKGATYWQDELDGWDITLYLVGSINGQVAEIEVWV